MNAFVDAGSVDGVAPGRGAAVTVDGHTVALFRVDGAIFAIEGWCIRCAASLSAGEVQGRVVACAGCDWRYDLTTGSVVGIPSLRLHTFETKVVDGQIIVATL